MNRQEYWKEVESAAIELIKQAIEEHGFDDAQEQISDYMLHELVDSHEYIIYNSYHLQILQFSDNSDYMEENIGGVEDALQGGGVSGLHQALAFWAFYADIDEKIQRSIADYEPEEAE